MGWNMPIIRKVHTAMAKPVKYIFLSVLRINVFECVMYYFCKFTKINLYEMSETKKKHYLCQKYNL